MRILLVTLSDILPFALTQVLNPELEYCAIVVDEPDISKKMFKDYPQITNVIFPFHELKECIENFYYDIAVCISSSRLRYDVLPNELKHYGLDANKIISLQDIHTDANFSIEKSLRYYKEHVAEFEMFAIGMSYTELSIIPKLFKRKLFNFGRGSQDLYYDYQIAKYILEVCGGGILSMR